MNIYESIAAAMAEGYAIGKNSKNTQQGFMYRGIDAVMNTFQPILSKYKIFVVPTVLEERREDRTTSKGNAIIYTVLKIKYTFYAEDGSYVESVVIGEGMDSGDKSANKAMSVAMKYAMFQIFCIPTEEMIDPDGESHDLAPKKNETSKKSKAYDEYDPASNHVCQNCLEPIVGGYGKDGTFWDADSIVNISLKRYNRKLCMLCMKDADSEKRATQG